MENKKECVGCSETENLEKCEGTMCKNCWVMETREPDESERDVQEDLSDLNSEE